MKVELIVLSSALALPLAALAQANDSYRCTMGGKVRRVEIFHDAGVAVPCEVHYYKDTEAPGERQVLWRALNEAGYCQAQARDFVAKLEGLGWECVAGEGPQGAVPEPGRAAPDDTAVLSAPE
jgi:hypothetical protein